MSGEEDGVAQGASNCAINRQIEVRQLLKPFDAVGFIEAVVSLGHRVGLGTNDLQHHFLGGLAGISLALKSRNRFIRDNGGSTIHAGVAHRKQSSARNCPSE
ncbi:MAG TPA: hypothetical protein VFV81_05080 [Verrucomicrobiae bacterium]|nr:hypothetical protein [Verrucomicrobiae bacterium]